MPPESNQRKSKFSDMTLKQKITAVAVVVIFIIVIWQIIGLFETEKPAPAPVVPQNKTKTANAPGSSQQPGSTNPDAGLPAVQQVDQTKAIPITVDNEIVNLQRDTQDKYLKSINELQLLKIQRDIAETSQAIATFELAKVTAEKGISDILTRPAANANASANIPAAYLAKLSNDSGAKPTAPPPQVVSGNYIVLSVFMSSGNWQAVLGFQGKMYTVNKGDVLPMDGSIVTSIGKDAVVLEKDGQRRILSLIPPI